MIHKVNFAKDNPTTVTSYQVYFSLYQQLTDREDEEVEEDKSEDTVSRLASLFQKDFFDLIIVHECHRGSAKKDSNWRKILEYFDSAAQIGMTATPKETEYVSNIDYFGKPLYTYSLKEGIEDGFLVPFRVDISTSNIDDYKWEEGDIVKSGEVDPEKVYSESDFYNGRIQIKERDEHRVDAPCSEYRGV